MKALISFFLLMILLVSCAPAASGPEPEVVSHTFSASDEPILNPERGFFTPYELPGNAGFSPVRITGNTLVHLNIRLDEYRESDLPQAVLDGLEVNFNDIRDAGVKAIPRVAYNQGPYPDTEPDASKAWVLRHIEQLAPLFQKHSDVIAWVEAGFIGAWGEWHTSTNGLDNISDKRDILNALLAAIPGRYVQVRYPANIIELYPEPQAAAQAFVAHHNDCFLSSETDVGTYERDGENTILRDQAYLAELTRFTPMSGETCAPFPPRSACNSAIREMELLHFSALNEAYHKGIIRSWKDGGCLDEITNRLGYRLTLTEASFNEQVRPGGLLDLTVKLKNTGFAAPINSRQLIVVLLAQDNLSRYPIQLSLDLRQWQPGDNWFNAKIYLDPSMPEGEYYLALWLPDEAETLQNDPRYAVRFANENVWDEKTGFNLLGTLHVDKNAGGAVTSGKETVKVQVISEGTLPLPTSTLARENEPGQSETASPQAAPPISGIQISNDAQALSFQFNFTGATEEYNAFQVFLDTDQNPQTGMFIESIGADFMLEDDALFKYAGTGADWNWTELPTEIVFSNKNQTARWALPLSALDNLTKVALVFQLVDTNWDTVFVTTRSAYTLK